MLLGVAGKMGPSLARMALCASREAGVSRRVIGVSRFRDAGVREELEADGITTYQGDLLDESFLQQLPNVENIISMTGAKFGTAANASLSWGTNVYLPSQICKRFKNSRIVAFSTGNVYPLTNSQSGGCCESEPMNPVGEYGITAMGRERMYEYFSRRLEIPMTLLRLNYAVEMRYGVLIDIGLRVFNDEPVDLSMSFVNVIWQGDANAMALAALADASTPPTVLNVAGANILRVKQVAETFGTLFEKKVVFREEEQNAALLNNGTFGHQKYGAPRVDEQTLINWTADWIRRGGELHGKPTSFQVRDGKF